MTHTASASRSTKTSSERVGYHVYMDKFRQWIERPKIVERALAGALLVYFSLLGGFYALQSVAAVVLGDFGGFFMVLISGAVLIPLLRSGFREFYKEKDDDEFGHTRDPRI